MYQFIVILRAIACILITNSHQEEIYPIRILASGGLLGDVIYFAISGYCLYSIAQQSFGRWYFKRLKRVYPPVWITAGTFILNGVYVAVSTKRVLSPITFWLRSASLSCLSGLFILQPISFSSCLGCFIKKSGKRMLYANESSPGCHRSESYLSIS